MKIFKKKVQRIIAGSLAAFLLLSNILTDFPIFNANAYVPGETMLSGSAEWKFYCIDSYELLGEAGGVQGTNEWYAYVVPSTRLSKEDTAILFWATLSMMAKKGDTKCAKAIENIKSNAPGVGLPVIGQAVTEDHLKRLIHSPGLVDKYPWIKTVVANEDKYIELAGLLGKGGGSSSTGGKPIPTVLQNHTGLSSALEVDKNTFTISFDPSGADKDFIQKVPLKFSLDGGKFEPELIGGWTYQKTDTSIIFTNPNPTPSKLLVQFDPTGTEYQTGGGFASAQDAYDTAFQLWICIECNDRHVQHSAKKLPLEAHQRLVNLALDDVPTVYYAAIAGDPVIGGASGDIQFQIYRHAEDMTSTYNVQMEKYDHETGKPLADAVFKLYERFDDQNQIDSDKDGPVHIYEGGAPYKSYHKDNPVIWDDFKFVSGLTTDEQGYASKTINHEYHYDKTFCDGHPAPDFVSVPDEEVDELTGEVINEDEISGAQAENIQLAQTWLDCFAACEAYAAGAFDGVHFHWIMSGVDKGEIESVASSGGDIGSTPSAGTTTSASETEAFEQSGCKNDVEQTYDKFIALKYSYAFIESKARPGYILHDIHNDDLPIEVITTDSSENGANASFAGEYGKDITINSNVKSRLASETKAAIEQIEAYQLPDPEAGIEESLKKEKRNYLQEILTFFSPDKDEEGEQEDTGEDASEDMDLIDDVNGTEPPVATSSNRTRQPSHPVPLASPSDLVASPSNDRTQIRFSKEYEATEPSIDQINHRAGGASSGVFTDAYNTALSKSSAGADSNPGPDDHYSHCNGQDGEGDTWRIYDHRTEGEIHINKRDMDLEAGESNQYHSYGDTQGDGTLEGAVYGLFAATDLVHPDGKTGIVFEANNLVAVTTTDKEGDASFLAITEGPGHVYDYTSGTIAETPNGWAQVAPKNLYIANTSYDDYTEDRDYERVYMDNETNNGNAWIGRPLILGNYYVKELTRSEGYELSIGNKDNALTNQGQDYNMTLPTGTGYANVTRNLYADGQISANPTGEFGNPDIDELFFSAESKGTGAKGFDIVLNQILAGAKFYRLDTGTKTVEVEVGTGVYDKVYLTNDDGSPKYAVAENDYQYPKYHSDGSLMTTESPINYKANQFLPMPLKPLNAGKTQGAMEGVEPSMTKDEVMAKLAMDFTTADRNFLKGKVERALRANGKSTPKLLVNGKHDYSSIYVGIYDAGVRQGDPDTYGVSGVAPGQPAAKTVYGSPVVTLEIPKEMGGVPIKVGDAILTVLDYYNTNGFYSYGGIDAIEETADQYLVTVYASVYNHPLSYMVIGTDPEQDSIIYHRVPYIPDDQMESPRFVYVTYSNNPSDDAFGTYTDYKMETFGNTNFASALLITDAVIEGDGTIVSKKVVENVYYKKGDIPKDENGNPIQQFAYQEQTVKVMQDVTVNEWTELPITEIQGKQVAHIGSSYTDRYGAGHQDTDLQTYSFRVLLPQKEITLTQADIDSMYNPSGWSAGEKMGSAAYYIHAKHSNVKAYLNYADLSLQGASSYVQAVELVYPNQEYIWQDGENKPGTNTRTTPVALQERPIKQQIKVTKTINKDSYHNTNSYSEVHEDWFTRLFGGFGAKDKTAQKMDNFRFKTYLKINLEQLYRDENGVVIWQDRKGNQIDVIDANEKFPETVSKIFTRVPHRTDPLWKDSDQAAIANDELYSYTRGLINETQNPGYTAVLETAEQSVDDGTGTRLVMSYRYDKLFDAIAVANHDKWKDANPTYTSWQPIGNAVNRTTYSVTNAKASDQVRQFAIDWYLDDEIAKLVRDVPANATEKEDADGNVAYADELYDEALHHALAKAENYLKPFFAYDLDRIYAIEWDRATQGGEDRDLTTLTADENCGYAESSGTGYYFGLSEYLPYGTYVVVEQQPRYEVLEDFANKHYQIDRPREVSLPEVYASYDGSQQMPELLNDYYQYDTTMTQKESELRYRMRFNEETHVITAHNHYGDFEVYKYGMDLDRITNGATGAPGNGDYFALTQSEFRPMKNYYNAEDDRKTGDVPYYLTEGQSGRDAVSKYYRYSSVSEQATTAHDVPYPGAPVTEDNPAGIAYRDNVTTMEGMQRAYHDKYASMLVPYSVTAPVSADTEAAETTPTANGESSYVGYAYSKFKNRFYTAKLRIEKLDSETHENILHDGAIFHIYAAKRDDSKNGSGQVMFYEKDTQINGTKEFLLSMGATNIQPVQRTTGWRKIGNQPTLSDKHTGMVPAGTPICLETEKIILGDSFGTQTVAFKSYSTVRDGQMKEEANNTTLGYQNQTVGYLETPQPLGAGAYVICEVSAPTGYARTKPVALEIYSDKVSYYKQGNRDERVLAALYEYESDNQTTNGNKPQDQQQVARIDVENAPIKLQVEKIKESTQNHANTTPDKSVTYQVSGRVDGKLVDIGNNSDYVYAYDDGGDYLGYGWQKGTLEYLASRKAAGESVELVYEGKHFAGYGYVTRTLETADDVNPYVAGATMTLFDALALEESGDTQDHAFEGLVVERTNGNNVSRMYVKEGYAGETIEFVKEVDENGQEYVISYQAGVDKSEQPIMVNGNIWSAVTLQRPDTDILYYDLDSLDILVTENVDGKNILYGYDRNRNQVPIAQLEADKQNISRTDTEYSIFAFKGGSPYLEFVGGDFAKIVYSSKNKIIEVPEGTTVYHIDRDGNRDALVDPYTGMAYIIEQTPDGTKRVLVWAVNIHKDAYGNVIARDKITTSRVATIGENQDGYGENATIDVTNNSGKEIPPEKRPYYEHTESGSITGTWKSDAGEESHKETSLNTNQAGQNMNDEGLVDDNNGRFDKELNPVYDRHGLPEYYQRSDETYDKSTDLYDRNGDFVRQQDSDNLAAYNENAYRIHAQNEIYDGQEDQEGQKRNPLYHRLGEGYILENTWTTSDQTPNDPFQNKRTDGQPDILKRLPKGIYIMEELRAPAGYVKGLPTGITVEETDQLQHTSMIDKTTKGEISKVDGTKDHTCQILDMRNTDASGKPVEIGTTTEGMGTYQFGIVAGAEIALYEAEKVYTADVATYPKGYYLKKTGQTPVRYPDTGSTASVPKELTAQWTTGYDPIYLEGIPEGYYVLEEIQTPDGFVTSKPVEIEIVNTAAVQSYIMYDDHTKVEIEKYYREGTEKHLLADAGFTLYEAVLDANGNIVMEHGKPKYDPTKMVDQWVSSDASEYQGFMPAFEAMYRANGTKPGTSLGWSDASGVQRSAAYVSSEQIDSSLSGGVATNYPTSATMIFRTDDGQDIRITVYESKQNLGGRDFQFEYQFNYKKLPGVNGYANSYLTLEGRQRLDYLPTNGTYVLVETDVPAGFAKAEDLVIGVLGVPDVQRYEVENIEGMLVISKVAKDQSGELSGARLALYRAGAAGELIQEDGYLSHTWMTGEDGRYTELDAINKRIPAGYQPGDLKPHAIKKLTSGTYWLVELQSPSHYTRFAPVKIDYRQEEEIRIERVTNTPVAGMLRIQKTDAGDKLLSGVTFELSAYRKQDRRNPVLTRTLSDVSGMIMVTDLPVGETQPDGSMDAYLYKLREMTPPDGYATNTQVFSWEFSPDNNGISYAPGESATQDLQVINNKTKISISKKDFDALGDDESGAAFVAGAEFALYEITGRDDQDHLIYDESNPFTTWTTSKNEKEHSIEGLIASRSYLLKERKAPAGYNQMKPVVFTLSADGRKIASISNRLNTVTVNYIEASDYNADTDNADTDSIQSVTLKGRYVTKVIQELTDEAGIVLTSWIPTDAAYHLTAMEGIEEGKAYTITEKTRYSDGTEMITAKKTKTLYFDEEGICQIPGRTVKQVELSLAHADGTIIETFPSSEFVSEHTVKNNISPENPVVTMRNRNGKAGDAINPKQAILNTVTYYNPSNMPVDMDVTIQFDSETAILDAGTGTQDGKKLTYRITGVKPLESGTLHVATETSGRALSCSQTVTIKYNGNTTVTTKTVPVLQEGQVTIYNELTGSGKRIYEGEESTFVIRLYDARNGAELQGSYVYSGSRSGNLRSGDRIVLEGNEFITIDPDIYKHVRYQVERKEDGKEFAAWETSGTVTAESGSCATYTRHVLDTSERVIFQKGAGYVLTEETTYSDGTVVPSNRLQVTLNKQASITNIVVHDKRTKVSLSKVDITGEKEIPGCNMSILDQNGRELLAWTSGEEPYEVIGILMPGERYILREEHPAPGYAYAADVTFTINEDGTIDHVVMVDKPTHVVVSKVDITGEEELPGNRMRITRLDGTEAISWISSNKPYEIKGLLIAGETYILEETQPKDGYAYAEAIQFTVSLDGSVDQVTMKNDRTKLQVQKLLATDSNATPILPIEGATLQILQEDQTPAKALHTDEIFTAGEDLIFESRTDFVRIIRQLVANKTYLLHEVKPAPGYAYAEDVEFMVSLDGKLDQVVMYDKPTHVEVSKTDITGEQELPGNRMQIKTLDGTVMMSWISGTEPHKIVGVLNAGETYILEEAQPKDGYAYAEAIRFIVSLDGSVDKVSMKNDQTRVSILKVDSSTNRPLSGVSLQIKNVNGEVLDEWISAPDAHVITGKLVADEVYYLHEVKPLPGYNSMRDLEFKVPHGAEILMLTFENKKTPGGGDRPENSYISFRKMGADGRYLAGAEFSFYASDGSLYALAVSDEHGVVKIETPADGTYTYQETKAPDGYLLPLEIYSFTIYNGRLEQKLPAIVNHEAPEITLTKRDGESWNLLAGATIRIWNASGFTVTGVTDASGSLRFRPLGAGTYYLQETKAPDGYTLNRTIYEFTVLPDGSVTGTTTIFNYETEKKIGKVYASYSSKLRGKGFSSFGMTGTRFPGLPKTGDFSGLILWITWVLSMVGIVFIGSRGVIHRKDGESGVIVVKKRKLVKGALFIAIGALIVWLCIQIFIPLHVYAAEPSGPESITQISTPFTDDPSNHIPEETIEESGKVYHLKSYQVVDTVIEAQSIRVSDDIVYEEVEQVDQIPATAEIEVEHEATGTVMEKTVPLKEYEYTDYRWVDGFSFPITVEEADADYFAMGDELIPNEEYAPFNGYEDTLLDFIGVSKDAYEITQVEWQGDAWEEDGTVFRQAVARGRKIVASVRATYEGMVTLEEITAKEVQAIYSLPEEPIQSQEFETITGGGEVTEEKDEQSFWEKLLDWIKQHKFLTALLVIFLLLLFLIMVLYILSRRKQEEERPDGIHNKKI